MKSLKKRVYLQLLILIISTSVLTSIISYVWSTQKSDSALMKEAKSISVRTAQSLAFPFWNVDSIGVTKILEAQIQNSNMYAISIEGHSDGYLPFVRGVRNSGGDVEELVEIDSLTPTPFTYSSEISFEGEYLGQVTVMLTNQDMKSLLIHSAILQFIVECITLLFLALPLSYIIANSFTRPIEKLADSFRDVMVSNFETPVSKVEAREIQQIGDMFEKVRVTLLAMLGQVRRNEKDLTTILNSIADAIVAIDNDNHIIRLNPVAEQLIGWSEVEALGKPLSEVFVLGETNDESQKVISTLLDMSKPIITARSELYNGNRESIATVDITSSHLIDVHREFHGMVLVIRDVTEELQVQDELKQRRKMESLGQLSGGVAHDFNNMLGGIIGFAELIKSSATASEEEIEYSQYILDAANSATDLTAKLLAFSRKGKMVSTPFSIHKTTETAMSLLMRTINKNISISGNYNATNHYVSGDPSQIQNAILNLCINAKDAMLGGGDITVTTEDVAMIDGNSFNLAAGEYIKIMVADTGEGMSDEIKERIFEPFFTTKSYGKGTGLGLAAVYGAVQNHNGVITVDSTVGVGTTFTVLLPTVPVDEVSDSSDIVDTHHHDFEKRVLVVDDEKIIRAMLDKMISELGGEVTQVADGVEAVALFREKHNDIDIVILDMVMPNMNGDVCFYELRKIDPEIPIIVSSGFDKNLSITELINAGAVAYLHKPFNFKELAETLKTHSR